MCVLWVTGQHFDLDGPLESSGLTPYKVFRKGERRFASRPDGKRREDSGFAVDVSRGSRANLVEHVSDAVAFLRQHVVALTALRSAWRIGHPTGLPTRFAD
jgi:hypothetical protein